MSGAGDDDLARAVFEVSVLTHREVRSLVGALAIAWTAARLAKRGSFPLAPDVSRALLGDLAQWAEDRESWMASAALSIAVDDESHRHDFSSVLQRVLGAWDGGWPAMRHEVEAFARTRHPEQNFATAGFVLCSVASALAIVLSSTESAEETLVRAVNLGGDADTVGAMVGGLLGAAAGPEAFPARWCVFPGSSVVRAVGRALEERERSAEQLPDLLALEIELTHRLNGRRRPRPIAALPEPDESAT